MAATLTATETTGKTDAKVAQDRTQEREKALRILAKSIFKELKSQGYETKQIVGLATELLAQVTDDLHTDTAR
jgi:hypothetical protein